MGNHPAFLSMKADKYTPRSVVLITGATKGIGRELAVRYARRGCYLVLAARGSEGLEATRTECVAQGAAACLAVQTDVTKEEDCAKLVRAAFEEFGRLDVLILNAGVSAHFPFSEFADMGLFRRLLDVNFFGYVYCTKYALPHLKRSRGQIVVISSMSGEIGLPLRSAYCASKFAVTGFFEALRMEYGDRIDVTICCPPSVKTGMRDSDSFAAAERLLEELRNKAEAASPPEAAASPQVYSPDSAGGDREGNEQPESTSAAANSGDRRMPVEVCVDYIMKAADKRARKVMFPLYSYLAVYMRPFLPDIIDPLIKRAAKL